MAIQKKMYKVTFKTASGILTRMLEADNMFQAREKIKESYARTYLKDGVKIISVVKIK